MQSILAENIKIARNRLGLSQARLAEICELSTSFVGEIELGKKFPSAQNFERLSEALGLRPYQLLYEKEEWEIYDKYDNIADMKTELKEKLNALLEEVIRKHLRSS
ncbi:MAG: helix-turn-helix domain-containing protein [Spirochaetales bacterium]|nr:helix-turn-helix domain-containing protein [Spirochaetales bacterium]